MDTDMIVKLIKSFPRDKWEDKKTIEMGIKLAAKVVGKEVPKRDKLDVYIKEVQKVARGGTSSMLFSKIKKMGYTKEQIDEVRRKLGLI